MTIDFQNLISLIQYPSMLLTCCGYYFVGSTKPEIRKIGFFMGIIGNITWMIYALLPLQPGLIFTNVVIFIFGVRGYLNNTLGVNEELLHVMEEMGLVFKKD